MPNSN